MTTAIQKAQIRAIHPFPARMAPSIVWDALPDFDGPLKVLDPMSGSGTSLVCARDKGHFAIGCDLDPLARLIAKTWCLDINPENIKHRASLVLERAKFLAASLNSKNAYPSHTDRETQQFMDFWFDQRNRIELTALSTCIRRVKSENEKLVLWCALSRLVITKAMGVSLAMDVSHSRPHKVYDTAPIRPFDKFLKAVDYIVKHSPFQSDTTSLPIVDVKDGDARSLPIETESIDMIITSPPYLNAIDYLRGHKLSLVWMGYNISHIRNLRSENIGSEKSIQTELSECILKAIEAMCDVKKLDSRSQGFLKRYAYDMNNVLKECARVIKKSGNAVFVVGDSALQGTFIKNSDGIACLASNHGFSLSSRIVRIIPDSRRYLPPPTFKGSGKQLQMRMREEVVLKFTLN